MKSRQYQKRSVDIGKEDFARKGMSVIFITPKMIVKNSQKQEYVKTEHVKTDTEKSVNTLHKKLDVSEMKIANIFISKLNMKGIKPKKK